MKHSDRQAPELPRLFDLVFFTNMIYDDDIMRTIIDLPEEQVLALADLCKKERISRAEAVRKALSNLLAKEQCKNRSHAFGTWKNKAMNSRAFVEQLRGEWPE